MMAVETRTVTAQFELRDASTDAPTLEGYASVFDAPYDMGPFWEQVDRRAFDRTLGSAPDVRLLIDHQGQPLARTKSGTLDLSTDSTGLHVRANLEPSDPDVQRLLPKMRRGDLDQMSFAFRVPQGGDSWDYTDPERTLRTLNEVNLSGGDVSVVTYPASPTTSAQLRCLFVERAAQELREGRALPPEAIAKLRTLLDELAGEPETPAAEAVAAVEEAEPVPARGWTPDTLTRVLRCLAA